MPKITAGKYKGVDHPVEPRNEARILIEVDVEPQNGTVICGQHLKHGKQRAVIYESELDAISARVRRPEHEADLKAAQRSYENALDQHMTRAAGRDWRTVLADPQHRDHRSVKSMHERYGESSPWSEFARFHKTGMPPLKSLEVIEQVPPPDTAEARADRADDRFAHFAQMVAEAIAGKQSAPAKAR